MIHRTQQLEKEKLELLEKVRPQMQDLERQRRELLKLQNKNVLWSIVVVAALAALVVWCLYLLPGFQLIWGVLLVGAAVVYVGVQMEKQRKPMEKKLRQLAGDALIKNLYPDWTYSADSHLPATQFERLGLVRRFDKIEGGNLIHGKHGDTAFTFSHINLLREGENQTSIFDGLIIVADFHKEIKGKTLVFPDVAQKSLGSWLGKKVQEFGWKGLDLIYLEDPAFEKAYAVYSSDPIEARYILTPAMMTQLVVLSEKYDNNLSFSFTNGKVCIAIKNVLPFETSLVSHIKAEQLLLYFNQPVDLVKEVIDVMNLNTRIWTKDPDSDRP